MDRSLIQVGELPCVEDFLFAEKAAYLSMSAMIASAIGPSTGVAGFGLSPTSPSPSLQVVLGAGWIYQSEVTDTAAFGAIGTDPTVIMKQGISPQPTTLTITPPATSGYSQYYIIEVGFNEVDTGSTLAPFYNSVNPSAPSSATINTIRNDLAVVSLKAGAAAPTGTQTVPVPDAGFTALWSILVVNGQTTITSTSWARLALGPYNTPWFPNLESLFSLFVPLIPTTTFYVSLTGNDTWDGTVATFSGGTHGPFATIQHAVNIVSGYSFGGQTVTIQLANVGTYSGTINIFGVTTGTLIIQGNAGAQASYVISGTPPALTYMIGVGGGGTVQLIGLTLSNQGGSTTSNLSVGGSTVFLQNVTFAGVTGTQSLMIANGGAIIVESGCVWAQSATACWTVISGGSIGLTANTTTSGAPVWATACIVASANGSFNFGGAGGWTFTNTGATGPRYSATLNGIINTSGGGANWFPGSTVGSTATGGQYA